MNIYRVDNRTPQNILKQIALMHEKLLQAGVLAKLGRSFLIKFYKSLVNCKKAAIYVIEEHEEVLAYVSCTTNTNAFYKEFLYKNWETILLIIPKLCKPRFIKRSFSLLNYLTKKPLINSKQSSAELLSIVVLEKAHRRGFGGQLLNEVNGFMKENGISHFKVVAAQTQKEALEFYHARGGVFIESIELGHLISNVYLFYVL